MSRLPQRVVLSALENCAPKSRQCGFPVPSKDSIYKGDNLLDAQSAKCADCRGGTGRKPQCPRERSSAIAKRSAPGIFTIGNKVTSGLFFLNHNARPTLIGYDHTEIRMANPAHLPPLSATAIPVPAAMGSQGISAIHQKTSAIITTGVAPATSDSGSDMPDFHDADFLARFLRFGAPGLGALALNNPRITRSKFAAASGPSMYSVLGFIWSHNTPVPRPAVPKMYPCFRRARPRVPQRQ
jgi:hypothetical protein